MNAITPKQDWGALGPAMMALPNNRWRIFVEAYVLGSFTNGRKNNFGAQAEAARMAGFGGPKTQPKTMTQIGWKLMRDDRIIAAVAEESRKLLRSGAPEAVRALLNVVRNPAHKDHARAIDMVISRVDPIETRQTIDVTHRHIDAEQEEIEELRALRMLGTSREKMIQLFGGNGLERIERLEAADTVRRAQEAKIIDGEAVEIEPELQGVEHGER